MRVDRDSVCVCIVDIVPAFRKGIKICIIVGWTSLGAGSREDNRFLGHINYSQMCVSAGDSFCHRFIHNFKWN